jgi:GR25 family glycosyltransferase involved in LPS biosynthesis
MRLYYINLDREEKRRAHMEQALQGLDHERVTAVNGSAWPPTEKGPTRFEIACLQSHRAAWQRFLATPAAFACFLEDDVHFSSQFPAFVTDEAWIPADAHAVKLDSFFNEVMLGAPLPAPLGRNLALLYTRHESCATYILSRRGAETFLRLTEIPNLPVDYIVFPEDPIGQDLRLYQLSPAAAIQDSRYLQHYARGHDFASAISKQDRVKPAGGLPRLMFKLKRETMRILRAAPRAKRYLVNRLARGLKPEIVPFQ